MYTVYALCLLAACGSLLGQSRLTDHEFRIIGRKLDPETERYKYFYTFVKGDERTNNSLNRLSIRSEDQSDYQVPESGCGPTAMLNILMWYEKFGLIKPYTRNANREIYKREFFNEIDRRILVKAGEARSESRGTHNMDSAIVMDEIVHELSNRTLRLHTKITLAPLKLKDMLDSAINFRAGYLVVEPKLNEETTSNFTSHAATFIRADRSGYVTLGTWGQIYRGQFKTRKDGQWFVPTDPTQIELKIVSFIAFIPFTPTAPVDR